MTPVLCRFFSTGCSRKDCKYEHTENLGYFKQTSGCWFKNTKLGCRFGKECRYEQQETKTLTPTKDIDRNLKDNWLTRKDYQNDMLTMKNLVTATTNLLSAATSEIQTLRIKVQALEQKDLARQLQLQQSNEIHHLNTDAEDNPTTDSTNESDETDENGRNATSPNEPKSTTKTTNQENNVDNDSDSTAEPDENSYSQDQEPNKREEDGGEEEGEEEEEEK